jgi:hypothetical protein
VTAFVAGGDVFALLLAVTAIEALALIAWRRLTGRGLAVADILFHLSAGVFLCAAAWLALAGAGWGWVLACFAGSGIGHALDLQRRWARAT